MQQLRCCVITISSGWNNVNIIQIDMGNVRFPVKCLINYSIFNITVNRKWHWYVRTIYLTFMFDQFRNVYWDGVFKDIAHYGIHLNEVWSISEWRKKIYPLAVMRYPFLLLTPALFKNNNLVTLCVICPDFWNTWNKYNTFWLTLLEIWGQEL